MHGCAGGFATLLEENVSRRIDLALYCISRAGV
jgi:hypothetical protein